MCLLIVPELVVKLLSLLSVRTFDVTIVIESSTGKVVHVDPYGPSPVGRVVLCVVLWSTRGRESGREGGRESGREGGREREREGER